MKNIFLALLAALPGLAQAKVQPQIVSNFQKAVSSDFTGWDIQNIFVTKIIGSAADVRIVMRNKSYQKAAGIVTNPSEISVTRETSGMKAGNFNIIANVPICKVRITANKECNQRLALSQLKSGLFNNDQIKNGSEVQLKAFGGPEIGSVERACEDPRAAKINIVSLSADAMDTKMFSQEHSLTEAGASESNAFEVNFAKSLGNDIHRNGMDYTPPGEIQMPWDHKARLTDIGSIRDCAL